MTQLFHTVINIHIRLPKVKSDRWVIAKKTTREKGGPSEKNIERERERKRERRGGERERKRERRGRGGEREREGGERKVGRAGAE